MMERINGVAEPDVNIFNVAKPDKPRLDVFELFCPIEVLQTEVKSSTKKHPKRNRKHSARGYRNYGNRGCDEWNEDFYYVDEPEFIF